MVVVVLVVVVVVVLMLVFVVTAVVLFPALSAFYAYDYSHTLYVLIRTFTIPHALVRRGYTLIVSLYGGFGCGAWRRPPDPNPNPNRNAMG